MTPELKSQDRLAIIGETGTGKSHFAKACLAAWMKAGHRIVGVDLEDELSVAGHQRKTAPLGPLTQRCTLDELRADPRAYLERGDLALAVALEDGGNVAAAEQMRDVLNLLKHAGDMAVLIEEVGFFTDSQSGALSLSTPILNEAATRWRKRDMPLVFVAQRTTQIPAGVRGSLSQVVAFRQTYEDDLDALEKVTKRIAPDFADRVARLPDREFLHWRKEC